MQQRLSRRSFLTITGATLAGLIGGAVAAGEVTSPVPGKRVALSGYDPIGYFTKGEPVKGSSEFWFAFDDTVYFFASAQHRAMFVEDPERYAPQYDGFCTMALSALATKLEPDPEAWVIHEGRLYVFGKKLGAEKFKESPDVIADKANAAWPSVRGVPTVCRLVDPTQEAMVLDCKTQ
ncbi:MAG TPA: YHS domain-containing (seleno)protein [Afifellaceae bacterium]|nr:YHS domain-containing (seleno)protein [Afifellaceae bacterium]